MPGEAGGNAEADSDPDHEAPEPPGSPAYELRRRVRAWTRSVRATCIPNAQELVKDVDCQVSKRMEFRMQDGQGAVIGLDSLLSLVGENQWVWSVLEFDGIGTALPGLGYAEIRDRAHSCPQGYVMSWPQVREFAARVQQCFDLLLVAATDRRALDAQRLAAGDFSECLMVLAAGDSTWWSVEVLTETEVTTGIMERVRARYAAAS